MSRQARSYTAAIALDGRLVDEHDAASCAHCQRVVRVKAKAGTEDAPGFCRCCMAIVCRRCETKRECTPFMRAIEAQEARGRALRSMGL